MKQWRAEQMGSEGWAVFEALRDRPYGHMLASNLTEEDAKLMAAAPALQQRVEALERELGAFRDVLELIANSNDERTDAIPLAAKTLAAGILAAAQDNAHMAEIP